MLPARTVIVVGLLVILLTVLEILEADIDHCCNKWAYQGWLENMFSGLIPLIFLDGGRYQSH
jgi:hypothetical protein